MSNIPLDSSPNDELVASAAIDADETKFASISPENWIFAPIAVTIQKMNIRKSTDVFQYEEHKETGKSFILQVLIPYLFAGLGLILAGVMLEKAEGGRFFTDLPNAIIMVPTLVGLKGNLEMTLSSRLSTLANLGFMNSNRDKLNVAVSNLALIQCQAIAVSSLAIIPVLLFGEKAISFNDVLALLLSAVITASFASLALSILMVAVVLLARRFKLNPDNISTPVAASLGDVSTLYILLSVGTWISKMRNDHIISLFLILIFFYILALFGAFQAMRDRFTLEVLKNGWWPILCAMVITTGSGFILKNSMMIYPPIAAFQPLINGLGGNLVAVQASRISTQLHRARKNREIEVHSIWAYFNPIRAFFKKSEDSLASRLLLLISIPSNFLFILLIFLIGVGFSNTIPFTITFLFVCIIQVAVLLYICQFLVRLMWISRIDPDNSAIPFLTAVGDLLGSILLIFCFWSQWTIFRLPVTSDQFLSHKFGH